MLDRMSLNTRIWSKVNYRHYFKIGVFYSLTISFGSYFKQYPGASPVAPFFIFLFILISIMLYSFIYNEEDFLHIAPPEAKLGNKTVFLWGNEIGSKDNQDYEEERYLRVFGDLSTKGRRILGTVCAVIIYFTLFKIISFKDVYLAFICVYCALSLLFYTSINHLLIGIGIHAFYVATALNQEQIPAIPLAGIYLVTLFTYFYLHYSYIKKKTTPIISSILRGACTAIIFIALIATLRQWIKPIAKQPRRVKQQNVTKSQKQQTKKQLDQIEKQVDALKEQASKIPGNPQFDIDIDIDKLSKNLGQLKDMSGDMNSPKAKKDFSNQFNKVNQQSIDLAKKLKNTNIKIKGNKEKFMQEVSKIAKNYEQKSKSNNKLELSKLKNEVQNLPDITSADKQRLEKRIDQLLLDKDGKKMKSEELKKELAALQNDYNISTEENKSPNGEKPSDKINKQLEKIVNQGKAIDQAKKALEQKRKQQTNPKTKKKNKMPKIDFMSYLTKFLIGLAIFGIFLLISKLLKKHTKHTIKEEVDKNDTKELAKELKNLANSKLSAEEEIREYYKVFHNFFQKEVYELSSGHAPPPLILSREVTFTNEQAKQNLHFLARKFGDIEYGQRKINQEDLIKARKGSKLIYNEIINGKCNFTEGIYE